MTSPIHVLGYGALGQEIVRQLIGTGRPVIVLQRSRPRNLPGGVGFEVPKQILVGRDAPAGRHR